MRIASLNHRAMAYAALPISLVLIAAGSLSAHAQTFNSLYSFAGSPDGATAYGAVIMDKSGTIYGTTRYGGASNDGTVYKLSNGTETVLHSFSSTDGAQPFAGVVMDKSGTLYGPTPYGGSSNVGTIYSLDSSGTLTTLHSFTGGADGSQPFAGLLLDNKGNLYGVTYGGGTSSAGTVFKLNIKSKKASVLYSFKGGSDGSGPLYGNLLVDKAGNLYGTTVGGGAHGQGTVWMLSSKAKETVLYSFCPVTGCADGTGVFEQSLAMDGKGNLYGTTEEGGSSAAGVVFKLNKKTKKESVLYSFTGQADGAYPSSGLVRDSKGDLYGSTQVGGSSGLGVVFRVKGTSETVLNTFTGTDGSVPFTSPLLEHSGTLYGVTSSGGTTGNGTVFSLKP